VQKGIYHGFLMLFYPKPVFRCEKDNAALSQKGAITISDFLKTLVLIIVSIIIT
jgi:hypothetical protein